MPKHDTNILPFISVIKEVVTILDSFEAQSLVIGGVATSFLSTPRFTKDIDFMTDLSDDRFEELFIQFEKASFCYRLENAKETLNFLRKNRVLLLQHAQTKVDIDISFSLLPFEDECFKRAHTIEVEGVKFGLPSPEDLIIMKAIANRPKDLEDIRNLLKANPELEQKRILRWVTDFAEVLEMPELLETTKTLLENVKQR